MASEGFGRQSSLRSSQFYQVCYQALITLIGDVGCCETHTIVQWRKQDFSAVMLAGISLEEQNKIYYWARAPDARLNQGRLADSCSSQQGSLTGESPSRSFQFVVLFQAHLFSLGLPSHCNGPGTTSQRELVAVMRDTGTTQITPGCCWH